jgi:hypothetical protein
MGASALERKGALARRLLTSPSDSNPNLHELETAADDLAWLYQQGALAGVSEIIRERRRQIEGRKYTLAHDQRQDNGWLMHEAGLRIIEVEGEMLSGAAGYPEIEDALRTSGALAAAEIDRLIGALTPERQEPRPPGMPDWWPAEDVPGMWGGKSGWALHLVHCRPDRCEIGCDCPHHERAAILKAGGTP